MRARVRVWVGLVTRSPTQPPLLTVTTPGAQQVVLVRSEEARDKLPSELSASAIVLTVFEAKGLEFNDVLLVSYCCLIVTPQYY